MLLLLAEAIEALQALSLGDSSDERLDVISSSASSSSSSSSLTFAEFTLLCADILSTEVCDSVSRLVTCVKTIHEYAHHCYIDRLTDTLNVMLREGLVDELGLVNKKGSVPSFKLAWKYPDDDNASDSLPYPVYISSPLITFLFTFNNR